MGTTKSCGNVHAYCGECRPDVADKVRRKLDAVRPNGWNRGRKTGPLSVEHRAKISATNKRLGIKPPSSLGRKQSDEAKAKIRAANLGRKITWSDRTDRSYTRDPEWRRKVAIGVAKAHARGDFWRGPTSLEYALSHLLQSAGLEYEAQVRFGRYVVDFWVPSHNLVFEADGSFWNHHKDAAREATRDSYLRNKGALAVIHLNEIDLDGWTVPS